MPPLPRRGVGDFIILRDGAELRVVGETKKKWRLDGGIHVKKSKKGKGITWSWAEYASPTVEQLMGGGGLHKGGPPMSASGIYGGAKQHHAFSHANGAQPRSIGPYLVGTSKRQINMGEVQASASPRVRKPCTITDRDGNVVDLSSVGNNKSAPSMEEEEKEEKESIVVESKVGQQGGQSQPTYNDPTVDTAPFPIKKPRQWWGCYCELCEAHCQEEKNLQKHLNCSMHRRRVAFLKGDHYASEEFALYHGLYYSCLVNGCNRIFPEWGNAAQHMDKECGLQFIGISKGKRKAYKEQSALKAGTPESKRIMISDCIYRRIIRSRPELDAGKITGMLLEMNNEDLVLLLENPEEFDDTIQEALELLQAHSGTGKKEQLNVPAFPSIHG